MAVTHLPEESVCLEAKDLVTDFFQPRPNKTMLRIGDWCVNPATGQISRDNESARLEARTMRLLLCLAEHAGEVVSIDDLLDQVWAEVTVSQDSVYQAVTSLRRILGDDPKQPAYIATVPRLGYRMVAKVGPWVDETDGPRAVVTDASEPQKAPGSLYRTGLTWGAGAIFLGLAVIGGMAVHGKFANTSSAESALAALPQRSIAVLPFLDLTERMSQEEFADGMTEELIDKLSKIPGFRVPAPTSSFYFKGKQVPVAQIAKSLGVTYVLDGSTRKSGDRVRVAARLVRAENGYVIWTETYDRPWHDAVMIQDDIAGEVSKALRASIDPGIELR